MVDVIFVCFLVFVKMDEDQWTYDSLMYEEFDMDFEDEEQYGVNEWHVDCLDAFNTSQVMMFISFSRLVECMFCIKNNMWGLLCRSLVPEMIFCCRLDLLPMKMGLLQLLLGLTQILVVEEEVRLC